jgi:UDP-N-acetylglucosamine acyltransferase
MAYVHIAHDCEIKNHTILANNTSLAGHVLVDDYAILGGFTLVHQFCKIGSHIITAVNTVVFKDIPPYVIAAGYDAKPNGINAEGLKRRGFDPKVISKIKEAYKILYRQGHSLDEAKDKIKLLSIDTEALNLYIDFIAKSTRGIIR